MPARPPSKPAAPAEILSQLNLGYNGYTDPTLTNPKMWFQATNVFSGAFGFIQRCRFATVFTQTPGAVLPFTSLKYFAIPGTGAYLLGDQSERLYSYDTSSGYTQTQRINPYVDPAGTGSPLLNGPFSRETLQSIVYEMNGQVKMAGRGANAAIIEGWGLDAPDTSPQVGVFSGSSVAITAISRTANVVTATAATLPTGLGAPFGSPQIFNVVGVTDTSFNGSFLISWTGAGPFTFTWTQLGNNTTSSGGNLTTNESKAIGRSYAYAWENANKAHVGAPSPATQYFQYTNQAADVQALEAGTVATTGTAIVTGTNTAFTSAWVGRKMWLGGSGTLPGIIASVQTATQLTMSLPTGISVSGFNFQVFDPQATHVRWYATADGGATYSRIARTAFLPAQTTDVPAGLHIRDFANAEPPNFPFTTETAQSNNLPPPIGQFVNEYQGVLLVYGVSGAAQSFFYSNQTATSIGLLQESFAPLNQVTLPIQNAQLNGMLEFPGSLIIWSDKQDMFRLTGLLTDNTVTGVAQGTSAAQQGAQIARLPYNLGCATPFAAEITPLGGIWLTTNAEVWLYTDRYAPRNIGRPIQDILGSANPANLNLARMKYYHNQNRNWLALAYPANGASYNNTLLVLDLDLLASNGSPSYFTFDMATNSPAWWIFSIGAPDADGNWVGRCDSIESVYEANGAVRLLTGQVDLIQDVDYQGFTGTEISVPNGTLTTHAWGNETATSIKRPTFVRFNTNRDPATLESDAWSFQVQGADDDFYTLFNPLVLALTPGVNDTATLSGNPDFVALGSPFRTSQELFRIGSVNFVMGRRLRFQVNFPTGIGSVYQLRSIQLGFGANPPN